MIPRVILLGGLPGSGKTPYLDQLRAQGWNVFDDFQANAHENSPRFQKARCCEQLIQALRKGRTCVVSDMRVLCPDYRQEAQRFLEEKVGSVALEWQFFRERCRAVRAEHPSRVAVTSTRAQTCQAEGVLSKVLCTFKRRSNASMAR